jgi:hypothetical protein
VGSGGVVWEVFEDRRFEDVSLDFHTDAFSDGCEVPMVESKVPDISIKIFPLSQTANNLFVKLFVFEHPKDGFRIELVLIKNILALNEFQYFLAITRAENIIERLEFVDSEVFFDDNRMLILTFCDYGGAFAGIAGVNRVLSFFRGVEMSFELFGGECVEGDVDDLSIFMAAKRNCAFGDVQQDLEFQRSAGSVGDHGLANVRTFHHKLLHFFFNTHPILESVHVCGVQKSLVNLYSEFVYVILLFDFFNVEEHGGLGLELNGVSGV